ncbi:MAG: hypothetical protein IKZ19_07550 [Clostridia bacterium]|nr:hypothetical protein [Clostridia bacterium]
MSFKSIVAFLLVCVSLLTLTACSGTEPEETTVDPASTSATTAYSYITVGTTELRTVYMTRVPGGENSEPPMTSSSGSVLGTTSVSGTEATSSDTGSLPPAQTQATQSYPVPSQLALSVAPPSTDTMSFDDDTLDDYFSDAVFVGDSISLGWRNYVMSKRGSDPGFLGGAQFLVNGSLGAESALWDISSESVHPSWQGTQMQLWNSIPLTGAKKVFIMFGLNDVGRYSDLEMGIDMFVNNYDELIGKIKANAPDAEIYIISATYVVEGGEKGKVTSANLRKLNEALIDYCEESEIEFINFADALADANGNLASKYCSDGYVHQTNAAYDMWTALLKGYAAGALNAR